MEMEKAVDLSFFPQVSEVISLPIFRGSRLLGGGQGLEKPVEGFNLSDTPEYYKWISRGEIMLTTCFSIHKDPEALRDFVKRLAEKDISAVCIKSTQYLGKIPDFMVEQADEYGVPLIDLPPELQLSDVTKAISDELVKRQTAMLRSSLQINEMLTRTIIEGATLQEIAGMVAELVGTSVLILDSINHRRVLHVAKRDAEELANIPLDRAISKVTTDAKVHELTVGGCPFGYLYLYHLTSVAEGQEDVLAQVLQAIPLEISRERLIQERNNNDFAAFLRHLLSDTIMDPSAEYVRAAEYGLNLSHDHLVVHVRLEEQKTTGGHYAVEFQRTLLISNLVSLLTNLVLSPKLLLTAEGFLLLMSSPAGSGELETQALRIPEYFRSAVREYPALKLVGGCGRIHNGLDGLLLSRREAEIALKAATSRGDTLLRFADLGVLRLIYANDPEREIDYFIREKLGDLMNMDQARNVELMRTLSAYFDAFGNVKRMSEELYTHYNTVAYRLKTVQEVTGADFQKKNDRFEMELALFLYEFQYRRGNRRETPEGPSQE